MIVGDLVEGSIEAGAHVVISLGGFGVNAPIEGVEVVDVSYQDKSYLGLAIDDEGDPENSEFLAAMKIGNECIEIMILESSRD